MGIPFSASPARGIGLLLALLLLTAEPLLAATLVPAPERRTANVAAAAAKSASPRTDTRRVGLQYSRVRE